jgi:hypothetical protein
MEEWLPAEYQVADHLERVGAEELRSYVVQRRSRSPARTQAAVVAGVLRGLPGYALMLRDHVHAAASEAVIAALGEADRALDGPQGSAAALDALLIRLEGLPQAPAVLCAYLSGGWPNAEERRWLLFEALVTGESVGKKPLRWIRREDYMRAVAGSRSAEEIGLRPALRASRAEVAKVIALPGKTVPPAKNGDPEGQERTSRERAASGRKKRA